MLGLGEVRVYVLDDLLKRLGKDCEVCVYGPAKRRKFREQMNLKKKTPENTLAKRGRSVSAVSGRSL